MLFTKLFKYVMTISSHYRIDESHGLQHSMNTLYYANQIFKSEASIKPYIKPQERIIYVSAVLHDMCDKKYVDKEQHLQHIEHFLEESLPYKEITAIQQIISTMPYSYVKQHGFPDLCEYQDAYHIVREADLLTAYDFDRSLIYHLHSKPNSTLINAHASAVDFFENRAFKHDNDGLFTTKYAKEKSKLLQTHSLERMLFWKEIMNNETRES